MVPLMRDEQRDAVGRAALRLDGLEGGDGRGVVPVPALLAVALLLVQVGRHLVVELAAEVDEERDAPGGEHGEVPDRACVTPSRMRPMSGVDLAPALAPVVLAGPRRGACGGRVRCRRRAR